VAGPLLDAVWGSLQADTSVEGRPALLMDELEMQHWCRWAGTGLVIGCVASRLE
jgi:hypothetical protein